MNTASRGAVPLQIAAPGCSLLRYAPALALFLLVLADSAQYADTDLWGHVRFGQLILSRHRLIRYAPFAYSFVAGGPPWVDHEWLAQVVMALSYQAAGVVGLKLWKFACAAATVVLLALAQAETGASPGAQFVVLATAVGALVPQMQFRPQLFDYVALAALVAMLAREDGGRPAPLWLAVPVLALWANLHGGFVVGLVVLTIYTAAIAVSCASRRAPASKPRRLAVFTSLAAAATFANPYGPRIWRALLETARSPFTMRRVAEYQPLTGVLRSALASGVPIFSLICFLAMLAALLICLAMAPSAEDLGAVAAALVLSAGALYAVRNVALAVIALAAPLARHARLALERIERRLPGDALATRPAPTPPMLSVSVALARRRFQLPICALAIAFAVHQGLFSPTLRAAGAEPAGAVEFMAAHRLHGNVLCAYGWAVYLIWHQAPRSRVFIDSFEIMYPRQVQDDYLAFNDAGPSAARALDAYPTDFVLMPTGSPSYTLMTARAGWPLIYRDPRAALFARADSPAARIPGVPVLSASAPASLFP
jgi:hypothetical protein